MSFWNHLISVSIHLSCLMYLTQKRDSQLLLKHFVKYIFSHTVLFYIKFYPFLDMSVFCKCCTLDTNNATLCMVGFGRRGEGQHQALPRQTTWSMLFMKVIGIYCESYEICIQCAGKK
jgi:hypothetical protein